MNNDELREAIMTNKFLVNRGYSLITDNGENPHPDWIDRVGSGWWLKLGVSHPEKPSERFWARVEGVDGTKNGRACILAGRCLSLKPGHVMHLKVDYPEISLSHWHGVKDGNLLTAQWHHVLDVRPLADDEVNDDQIGWQADSWTTM
jgi:hypothetical protein